MQSFKLIKKIKFRALFAILLYLAVNNVAGAKIITHDYYVPYRENNTKYLLHVHEKVHSNTIHHRKKKVIVLLNPLSIPALVAFDIPHYSLMDSFAKAGYDVWGVDFMGEGSSSYYASMTKSPAEIGEFPLQATDAVLQLQQIIPYIQHKTGCQKVALLGWSWGSVVAAKYAIQQPKTVEHLILYGAMYAMQMPPNNYDLFLKPYATKEDQHKFNYNLSAYQNVPWNIIKHHWQLMIGKNKQIIDAKVFSTIEASYKLIDKNAIIKGTLRRPMGPMKDLFSIWNNQPIYDIKQLTVPTLVIYGDQDWFADQQLYAKLNNVTIKKEIHLQDATHWLIYEKARFIFIKEVLTFLHE